MSTTVSLGSVEVTSNTGESAQEMLDTLQPKDEAPKGKILEEKGVRVTEEDAEKEGLSKAASELGKKGGEAAARAKAAKEKEEAKAKPAEGTQEAEGEAEAAAEGEEAEKPLGKPRNDPKARIAQLAREKRDAEAREARERDEKRRLEARLAEMERRVPPAEPERTEEPEKTNAKPRAEDYEDYEEYLDARDQWNRDQWEAKQQERSRAEAATNRVKSAMETFWGRIGKAVDADATYRERTEDFIMSLSPSFLVQDPSQIQGHNVASDEVLKSEAAPELALYFSDHPDEFQRIATLRSRRDITREMAKLEVKLSNGSDAATAGTSSQPERSKAKPPGRPVPVSPHTDSGELDEDAPLSAFVARFGQRELSSHR